MLSFLSQFKHKAEMRESKDEMLIGEMVRVMARMGCPAINFLADGGVQMVRFKPVGDNVLNSVIITLDRKTGDSSLQAAVLGSKAILTVQAEVKNFLSDPDDLLSMYKTDLANLFKMPLLGDVRLDHQLNSVLATKKLYIDLDAYVNQGEPGVQQFMQLLGGTISELKGKLAQYKKG